VEITLKEPKKTAASLRGKQGDASNVDPSSELSINDISDILTMLSEHDVVEFEFERGDQKLWLKRSGADLPVAPVTQVVQAMPQPLLQNGAGSAPEAVAVEAPAKHPAPAIKASLEPAVEPTLPVTVSNAKEVKSPMVGTFYRRPAVDADPYVEVGDTVKKGDVLCIVEAMKIMNEIEADTTGRVVEVCLDDGQMVEYGEVMFKIEPSR
jgi:acetyl-CoA carboxylase biotin carboxyl carrier protein